MENSMSRILIETTVRQTLKGLKENPKRSIRNLVDMSLHFSEGRFQSHFSRQPARCWSMRTVRTILWWSIPPAHIETEHLVKFGMNLGYNSCTWGAQRIRRNEQRLGFNIPWTVLFQMDDLQCLDHLFEYDSAITEGEQLGIYTWGLLSRTDPMALLPLIEHHPDSCLFLVLPAGGRDLALLDEIIPIKHLMLVVRWEDGTDEVCAMLRDAQLPYSVYVPYDQNDLQSITSGELFADTQQLYPLFTILTAKPDCPTKVQDLVYQAVVKARNGQSYQTIPWELYHDIRSLDEIISDDACCVLFDGHGQLIALDHPDCMPFGSLFEDGITPLIRAGLSKVCADCIPVTKI